MVRIDGTDANEDFEHPGMPEGHSLRRRRLYRLEWEDWRKIVG